MHIHRTFTQGLDDPYSGLEFVERTSKITNADGSVVSEIKNVGVPGTWSQVAVDIMAQKYFRKAGVPARTQQRYEHGVPEWLCPSEPDIDALAQLPEKERFGQETDSRQVFHRLAGCWTYWGWKSGCFDSEGAARSYYDDMCFLLSRQYAAPNSPQWFNTGLNWAYGIEGPAQGHYFTHPETGLPEKSKTAYARPQPHACFILSVSDDLVNEGGIMDLWQQEARLFKYGSGTGTNFSKLRGAGEFLSGGGQSSGLMSFLKIGDRAAGAIKSGGTTRRAAKMVTLDIDHPDIEEFIEWKAREERKVAALAVGSKLCRRHLKNVLKSCWDWDDEENRFNIHSNKKLRKAVREALRDFIPENYVFRIIQLGKQGVRDIEFEEYDTNWTSEAYQTVSGQNSNNSVRLTNDFLKAVENDGTWKLTARTTGEAVKTLPARDLWDKINQSSWASADPGVQFDTTVNEWHTCPAGGRINASNPCSEYMFLDDTACNLASINLIRFYDEKKEQFDVPRFVEACRLWTLTLEISVAMAQFPNKAIAQKSYEYRTLGLGYANLGTLLMVQGIAYDSDEAVELARKVQAFVDEEAKVESERLATIRGVFPEWERSIWGPDESCARDADGERIRQMRKLRNCNVTTVAPTGTISIIAGCSSGIEPLFAIAFMRNQAGVLMPDVNEDFVAIGKREGWYSEELVQRIAEAGHIEFDEVPEHWRRVFVTANHIKPEWHIRMQAGYQESNDSAISKTCNFANDATEDYVEEIYRLAFELGCKGVTVYRDGSRAMQVLSTGTTAQEVQAQATSEGRAVARADLAIPAVAAAVLTIAATNPAA
ncbi:MAG: adenosylcobalamin-dependent ribonucleoside-diphosphate reductase [Nitrospinae bacterium]|nr:adenosylcobalamin-dependent ribonucleoside-diphosphate reductase [Nitrospinota bacterium]